ncbi:MAG: hypothetical protein ACW99Q_27870 [Candidatus Kariarchaeaceae archaeon]|jgi:hypothetical protein
MSDWIDIIGSFVIGSIVMLILTNLNISISTNASSNLYSNIVMRDIVSAADLIEHDLYKIGYRVNNDQITVADSNEIKFFSDIDNDGIVDEIYYKLSGVDELKKTSNPFDRILSRYKNEEDIPAKIIAVDFDLFYYDSLSQQISYADLKSETGRSRIETIKVRLETETSDKIVDKYESGEWEKIINPKNI